MVKRPVEAWQTCSAVALFRRCQFSLWVSCPYISASIIFQLWAWSFLHWNGCKRKVIRDDARLTNFWYATVALSIIQGFGISVWLQSLNAQAGTEHLVRLTGFTFKFLTVSLTSGTLLLMWMGEQISDRGIGNGISMIILPVS